MKNPISECIERLEISVFDGKRMSRVLDSVIKELSFEIFVNGKHLVNQACTGHHLEELAAGFLRAEGLIDSRDDLVELELSREAPRVDIRIKNRIPGKGFSRSISSSGARGISGTVPGSAPKADFHVSPAQVLQLMKRLMQSSVIHDVTRGTHCSALANPKDIVAAREDIGRHNTIDMLGGYALLNGIDCSDKILLTTGRVSSEIITKARRIGVSMVISHSVATSKAARMAQELNICLVGYVRGGKFRVYAGDRVSIKARKEAT